MGFNINQPPEGLVAKVQWLIEAIRVLFGRPASGSGAGVNIYNSDGALSANRTITGTGKSLTATGLSNFQVVTPNTNFDIDDSAASVTIGGTSGICFLLNMSAAVYLIGGPANQTKIILNDNTKIVTTLNGIATPSMQVYEGGSDVSISNGVRGLYYDPALTVVAATITLPETPVDGQEIFISFGGTVAAGISVISALTLAATGGQKIISKSLGVPVDAKSGSAVLARYRNANTSWYAQFIL